MGRGHEARVAVDARPPSVNGAEPSAGGWLAAPGQRRRRRSRTPSMRSARRRGQQPAGRVVGELERVEDRLDAREVAVGVVVRAPCPKSRNQPTRSGVYGRANSSTGCRRTSAWRPSRKPAWRRAGAPASCASPRRGRCPGRGGGRACAGRGSSAARRAPAGAARAGTARGPWSRAWTPRPARRGRRASRAGSRTWCWRAAGWSAAGRARASATFSSPIAAASRWRCRPARRGRRAARRSW